MLNCLRCIVACHIQLTCFIQKVLYSWRNIPNNNHTCLVIQSCYVVKLNVIIKWEYLNFLYLPYESNAYFSMRMNQMHISRSNYCCLNIICCRVSAFANFKQVMVQKTLVHACQIHQWIASVIITVNKRRSFKWQFFKM